MREARLVIKDKMFAREPVDFCSKIVRWTARLNSVFEGRTDENMAAGRSAFYGGPA